MITDNCDMTGKLLKAKTYHCCAYIDSIVFHLSLEGSTVALIVTVPCHCLSITLHTSETTGPINFRLHMETP